MFPPRVFFLCELPVKFLGAIAQFSVKGAPGIDIFSTFNKLIGLYGPHIAEHYRCSTMLSNSKS